MDYKSIPAEIITKLFACIVLHFKKNNENSQDHLNFISYLSSAVTIDSCQSIGLFLFRLIKHSVAINPHAVIHNNWRNISF